MHDLLLPHQDALTLPELHDCARLLGLNEERFGEDQETRRFALRVARDLSSADASGVAGTPTFFVNGRHDGAYDIYSLTAARRAAQEGLGAGSARDVVT
jgi:protein-disulfide isomerase